MDISEAGTETDSVAAPYIANYIADNLDHMRRTYPNQTPNQHLEDALNGEQGPFRNYSNPAAMDAKSQREGSLTMQLMNCFQ